MERDAIDEMLSEVEAQLPHIDTRGLAVGARVLVLGKLIERRVDACLEPHGIQLWGFDVLASLRRAGEPFAQTPTELMKTCFLTSGAVTNRINRLERLGLVQRRADPCDRRSTKVELTEAGRRVVENGFQDRIVGMQEVFKVLTEEERGALAGLLRKLMVSFHLLEHKSKP